MSATAEALLTEFQKLPASEQQELLRRLLHVSSTSPIRQQKAFPTLKLAGGIITSQQVAEALDDE